MRVASIQASRSLKGDHGFHGATSGFLVGATPGCGVKTLLKNNKSLIGNVAISYGVKGSGKLR